MSAYPRLFASVLGRVLLSAGLLALPGAAQEHPPPSSSPTAAATPAAGSAPAPAEDPFAGLAVVRLQDVLRVATERSPRLAAAQYDAEAAASRVWGARLYPNPSLELELAEVPLDDPGLGTAERTIALSQPLALGAKRARTTAVAVAEHDARGLAAADVARQVQCEVRLAWVALLFHRQVLSLQAELVREAEETVRVVAARAAAGAVTEAAVHEAQLRLYEAESGRRSADRQVAAQRARLRALLAGAEVPLDRIREELAQDLPELRIEDLLGAADSTNAALLGLRQDAHAAALRVLQAEAERVPDLELRLGYTRAGEVDEDRVAVSVSLPLPVFDRNQARIAEARDLAGKARCEADALGQEIATEMAELHATYMAARDDVVACRERAVPAATAALAQTRVAVPAGKASVLELLDVQERFAAARLALASATHDLHAAAARLTLLTGRDFPADSTRRN